MNEGTEMQSKIYKYAGEIAHNQEYEQRNGKHRQRGKLGPNYEDPENCEV